MCSCMTWKMFGLPCAHVCIAIRTMIHDVYEYVNPYYHVSIQHLIYLSQFQPLPMHNMPKVYENGSLQDGASNLFPALQPPQVRRPPRRPLKIRIESQFSHKRPIHCSRCNDIGHNQSKCNNLLSWHGIFCVCNVFIFCTISHYSIPWHMVAW